MKILKSEPKIFNLKSIKSKLEISENKLRFEVMNEIINTKQAYIPNSKQEEKMLLILKEKNTIDNEKEVKSIYPVSTKVTNKKVFLENTNRNAFAMCAVDALGMYYTFNENIIVNSECEYTHEKIQISVKDGKYTVLKGGENIRVLYKDLNDSDCWSCCCCVCIHFFKNSDVLEKFVKEKFDNNETYYDLGLDEAFDISKRLFSEK